MERFEISNPHLSKQHLYFHFDLYKRNNRNEVIERKDGIPMRANIEIPNGEEWILPSHLQKEKRIILKSLRVEDTLRIRGEIEFD